ncbi:MAG: hypothetical protein RIA65_07605, partial [Woeseia sp.]
SVIAIGSVTILYTFIGGAKSVIWNDCIQFIIYMLGASIAAVIITDAVPGGLSEIIALAETDDKFRFLDFNLSLVHPTMTFWAGLAGGAFLTAATHGTDQLMVQRYLSAKSQRGAAVALGLSGFIVLLQFAVFLLIGIGLAALFNTTGETGGEQLMKSDQLFAYFIVNYMPVGLLGLTLAAVFAAAMSTLSSSLNASAAVFMNDLYKRPPQSEPGAEMRANRTATIVFGIVQIGLAILFGMLESSESIVANVLKVAGFAIGPVLGMYFLAVFTSRVQQAHALTGFVTGVVVLSTVAFGSNVFWAWYALIGSLVTLAAGQLACALDSRSMPVSEARGSRE